MGSPAIFSIKSGEKETGGGLFSIQVGALDGLYGHVERNREGPEMKTEERKNCIEDFLSSGRWNVDHRYKKVYHFISDVLLRLPEDVFDEIVYGQEYWLFMLDRWAWGQSWNPVLHCAPHDKVESHHLRVISLLPDLENRESACITGVIAHEIGHAYMLHRSGEASKTEQEADQVAIEWGFAKEIAARIEVFGRVF